MKTTKRAKRCSMGCSFWRCARVAGHPGPCYPNTAEKPTTKMIFARDMMGQQILRVVPA